MIDGVKAVKVERDGRFTVLPVLPGYRQTPSQATPIASTVKRLIQRLHSNDLDEYIKTPAAEDDGLVAWFKYYIWRLTAIVQEGERLIHVIEERRAHARGTALPDDRSGREVGSHTMGKDAEWLKGGSDVRS